MPVFPCRSLRRPGSLAWLPTAGPSARARVVSGCPNSLLCPRCAGCLGPEPPPGRGETKVPQGHTGSERQVLGPSQPLTGQLGQKLQGRGWGCGCHRPEDLPTGRPFPWGSRLPGVSSASQGTQLPAGLLGLFGVSGRSIAWELKPLTGFNVTSILKYIFQTPCSAGSQPVIGWFP